MSDLGKLFESNARSFIDAEFSVMGMIKRVNDAYLSQLKLVTEGLDEEQVWAQLEGTLNKIYKNGQQHGKRLQRMAEKLAEKEEQRELGQEDQQHEEVEQDLNGEEELVEEGDNQQVEETETVQKKKKKKEPKKKQSRWEEIEEFQKFEEYLDKMDKEGDDDEEDADDVNEDEMDGEVNENDDEQEQDQNMRDDYEEDQENDNPDEMNDLEEDEQEDAVFEDMREMAIEDREVETLEQKMLNKKNWQMVGEVSARQRPVNSLIDENLNFQTANQAIEEMTTEAYQNTLEEKIKRRIQDELWDDRKRVQMSQALQDTFGSKKDAMSGLQTTKSQSGLAEIYESQFKAALGLPTNTSEQKAKEEIYKLYRDLSYKLDSLTNMVFEPRVVSKGSQSSAAISVIQREERVPMSLAKGVGISADGTKTKRQNFLSKDEALADDNQRLHRKAKRSLRNKLIQKKRKQTLKTLQAKGESKFMYNQVKKGKEYLNNLSSQIKQKQSLKFDKNSNFFKNLQNERTAQKEQPDTNNKQSIQKKITKKK